MSSIQHACVLRSKAKRPGPYDRASDERRKCQAAWVMVFAASTVSWQNSGNVYSQRGNDYIWAAFFWGKHVFWTWAPFSWTRTAGFFLGLGAQKMSGTCLCVFLTWWGYFVGPACICAGPRDFFYDRQINCF